MSLEKITKYFLIITIIFIGFSSCTNSSNEIDDIDDFDENVVTVEDTVHIKKVKKIFYNVPSPIEMANLMQKAGIEYRKDILNPISNKDNYILIADIALNLGVYGADLSYTRMFDQIQQSVSYLSSIRTLSDALGIPQEAGSSTISKMEDNMSNRDSLLQIITDTYSSADMYLKENDRGNTATLIIVGGWVEALYIATQVSEGNKQIEDRIAEQKFALDNLIELIRTYDDESLKSFLPKFEDLKTVFDGIEISYKRGDVKTNKISKSTVIESKAEITITKEQIELITEKVEKIRGEIVN